MIKMIKAIPTSLLAKGPAARVGGILAFVYLCAVGYAFIQAVGCSNKRVGGGLGGLWGCDFGLWLMTTPWSYLLHKPLELLTAHPVVTYCVYSLFIGLNAVGMYLIGLGAGSLVQWIISR